MRTGILTFHSAHNYGAMLQAYALNKITLRYGESWVVDYVPGYIKKQYQYFVPVKSMKLNALKALNFPGNVSKYRKFEKFRRDYLRTVQADTKEPFDVLLYGSDQIWNPNISGSFDEVYFGRHNLKTKYNVSYAASVGKTSFSEHEKAEFRQLTSCFDALSVREESSKGFLQEFCDKDIEVVLDPTLLLTKEEWEEPIKEYNVGMPYILVYEVNKRPETLEVAQGLSKMLDIPIVEIVYNKTKLKYSHKVVSNIGPNEFLWLFKKAEYVVTSSFHGTAFSINFEKQFFTIPHSVYSNRMTDLADKLGLGERIVTSLPEKFETINYAEVREKLSGERKKSIGFLLKVYGESNKQR